MDWNTSKTGLWCNQEHSTVLPFATWCQPYVVEWKVGRYLYWLTVVSVLQHLTAPGIRYVYIRYTVVSVLWHLTPEYSTYTYVYDKNYGSSGMLPIKNPILVTAKSSTSHSYNATGLTLQVPTYFPYMSGVQHCILLVLPCCRTGFASGKSFWHQDFLTIINVMNTQLNTILVLFVHTFQIQSKPGLNWLFQKS